MMYHCEQCAVWGYATNLMTQDEAELHLLRVHPTRFHKLFKQNADDLLNEMVITQSDVRDDLITALKARTE